jgi:hypothetical protein
MVKEFIPVAESHAAGRLAGRIGRVLVVLVLAGGLTGCGTAANKGRRITNSLSRLMPWSGKKDVEKPKEVPEPPRPRSPAKDAVKIGKIVYVQRDQGFALIKSTYGDRLATGTEIKGHLENGQEACSLRCSPERKPGFIVADIVSGDPQERQVVFVAGSAIKATEAGSLAVPEAGTRTGLSTGAIQGLPPSTGVDSLPPLPDFPETPDSSAAPVDALPDFPTSWRLSEKDFEHAGTIESKSKH